MELLRTPDERFIKLPDFSYAPRYVEVDGVRMHYIDEGPAEAPPVLLMHGEPTWSYLWHKVIPVLLQHGLRVLALDLVGFGRSDKPTHRDDHTYARHVAWVHGALRAIGSPPMTLVCHDWGGLIGLRVATQDPSLFARVVATNTGLPTGDTELPDAFFLWQRASQSVPDFRASLVVQAATLDEVADETLAAYDAPFPDDTYKAAPRQMPTLVPARSDDPAASANRAALERLGQWRQPFLCAFSDSDPVTRGADELFKQLIPGCAGLEHPVIRGAGHFVQEDRGEELAQIVADFIASTPL
ncbi:MAG: haloalkane dehalogenase [Candidatus Dormibacteraeota bacterium]|nr:haloalkane dehalogenase [Candidatus Dormibacteraeota bacterium]